jgi:hypothetical protein
MQEVGEAAITNLDALAEKQNSVTAKIPKSDQSRNTSRNYKSEK